LRSKKSLISAPHSQPKSIQHTVAELDNSARNRDELAFMSPHTSLLTIFP
jgi:uncharacterized protein YjiS (DUF1127 family)